MPRCFLGAAAFSAAVCCCFCCCNPARAAERELISEPTAARHGLTRPWFTQAQLDQGRGRLRAMVLSGGVLYVQTDGAVFEAIDAETGRMLWRKQVGRRDRLTMPPGVGHDVLAVLNGSHMYVLNRMTGEMLYDKEVGGAPSAAPGVSDTRVYVPLTSGRVEAYRWAPPPQAAPDANEKADEKTDKKKGKDSGDDDFLKKALNAEEQRRNELEQRARWVPPLFCQSSKPVLTQPRITRQNADEEYSVWSTDRGLLNITRIDRKAEDLLALAYRLETKAPVVGRPAYLPPDPKIKGDSGLILAASRDGFVHVIRQKDGRLAWRFSTGDPVLEPPVVVDLRVYVCTQLGGMYCLAANDGRVAWFAPRAVQLVAVSKTKVYAADRTGRLLVLDGATGKLLDTLPTIGLPLKLRNDETDRIYLADDLGLIQCLHEPEQHEPILHGKDRRQAEQIQSEETKKGETKKPAAKKPAAKSSK
ncbi:MAG: PQQ-binding-like beta-propeller repeat protein [Planctomycetaceae bacterium]|nr:PQQ-binding-like beta-propeller repeat protein [Planctomycetaceae bacterium]